MIIALDLCLQRGSHQIIDGLNLHIERGDFVFVCGQAGSGKTSLLRIIALQETPAAGRLLVDGRDLSEIRKREIPQYRREIGVIFEDAPLLPKRTLAENIQISLELAGSRFIDAKKESLEYLKEIELLGKATLYPRQVSENEKQMVKICRALARRPKIVLADEPYEALDWHCIEKAAELFKMAHLRGSTIVVATHRVELAERFGRRAIMLDKSSLGRLEKPVALWRTAAL
ncbi:MAG: hypothetical protein Kow0099_23620 [Candidatus Abyssubacteria bacterium]